MLANLPVSLIEGKVRISTDYSPSEKLTDL